MNTLINKNELLLNAYSTDSFKAEAQKIIDLIGNELERIQVNIGIKTIDRKSPQEQLSFWSNELVSKDSCSLSQLSKKIMEHSIPFHSRGYMDIK